MSQPASKPAIRDCAQSIVAAIASHGNDGPALGRAIKASLRELMSRPDLLEIGIPA